MSPSLLKQILKIFKCPVYIVGGALRDSLLGKTVTDLDIAVANKHALGKKAGELARRLNASVFPLDAENLVYRIIAAPRNKAALPVRLRRTSGRNRPQKNKKAVRFQIDLAPFQGAGIIEDLKKRDFTINSMAYSAEESGLKIKILISKGALKITGIKKGKVIDPLNGMKDLATRRIRGCAWNMKQDPLRMLRAFRIASQSAFSVDKDTLRQISLHADRIRKTAPERIRDEIMMLLENPESHVYFKDLWKAGLLFKIIPELQPALKCAEIYYGKGGALKHTFLVMERLEFLFKNLNRLFPKCNKIPYLKGNREILKFTALLHDIAKAPRAKIINGRLRFFGHESFGAEMSEKIMRRLRFSKEEIKFACRIICHHLRPGNLGHNRIISEKAVFRLFRDMGEETIPLLLLCWADYASYISRDTLETVKNKLKKPPIAIPAGGLPRTGLKKTLRFLQVINLLMNSYAEKGKYLYLKTAKIITGNDVMKILGIPESPAIGEFLESLKMLQFEGKIQNRKQAIEFLKRLKRLKSSKPR
ncbi:MAG: CCA tRNA nucleotidyltransferase [Elusimicrobia bacterium]|nr:CCA tRNA nucleotidyltransferase [Elusimicrobiota bacterium]